MCLQFTRWKLTAYPKTPDSYNAFCFQRVFCFGDTMIEIGDEFGRLTVIAEASRRVQPSGQTKAVCLCRCECGKEKQILRGALKYGYTRSCGCLNKEVLVLRSKTHGMTQTRPHNIWTGMNRRCRDKKTNRYHRYGGRGIKVCERWSKSFEAFWVDMREGYEDHLTLERVNNDKNYSKDNCEWKTAKDQANNRTTNRRIEFRGRTMNLGQWAEELDLSQSALANRLRKWPLERAMTEPPRRW